ncbi:hypothetical protein [Flavobacterium sp. MMS24-S5]|uniref:hypothetical protein n=1 Tax=Flavobacterium sp. MMS24-S5 TaxID=3416605 RepID=UPI003CFDE584
MKLSAKEKETFTENSLNVSNAIHLANFIEKDLTIGGVFPNGKSGDFKNPDTKKFATKWCSIWAIIKPLCIVAKVFTGDKADAAIDAFIALGDTACKPE